MIEVVCVCKRRFEVQDEHAGLSIKCPECRRLVSVPAALAPEGYVDETIVPDTIPPPGLHLPPGTTDPAPQTAPSAIAAPAARAEEHPGSLETLIRLGQTIRWLLAGILAALVLLVIQGFFRR